MSKTIILLAGAADKSKLVNRLLELGVEFRALVFPKSKKYEGSYKPMLELAKSKGLNVIVAPPKELDAYTQDIDFEILISSGYPFMIPKEVFSRAEHALNFHPTLLPKYRGRYLHPILINNDQETGVSCHYIDDGYDTGPIIKQIKYKVDTFDTIASLSRKNIDAEVELAVEVLDDITKGEIKAVAQNEAEASSFFEQRTPEDSQVDGSKPLDELFYEIRCCDPELYPAYFIKDGQKVYIKLFRKEKPEEEFDML